MSHLKASLKVYHFSVREICTQKSLHKTYTSQPETIKEKKVEGNNRSGRATEELE